MSCNDENEQLESYVTADDSVLIKGEVIIRLDKPVNPWHDLLNRLKQ